MSRPPVRSRAWAPAALAVLQAAAVGAGLWLGARPALRLARRAARQARLESEWARCRSPASGGKEAALATARLQIPAAGIDTLVLPEAGEASLLQSPCFARGGPDRGRPPGGMRVIIGHRDLHFRGLGRVRPGDAVRVRGRDNAARSFRVCDVEILDRDTARRRLEERGTEPWLVMMTCYPFRFIGPAPARYLVWARECPGGSS